MSHCWLDIARLARTKKIMIIWKTSPHFCFRVKGRKCVSVEGSRNVSKTDGQLKKIDHRRV